MKIKNSNVALFKGILEGKINLLSLAEIGKDIFKAEGTIKVMLLSANILGVLTIEEQREYSLQMQKALKKALGQED